MACEAQIHPRGMETAEMMDRLGREHASAFISRALCASVVKTRAKQSQFPGAQNWC